MSDPVYCSNCGQLAGVVPTADDVRTLTEQLQADRARVKDAISFLQSEHVQKNLFRLGVLGLQDVAMALRLLKDIK